MATLLKLNQVCELTTLSRSEIYKRIQSGLFPKPVKIGPGRSAWPHHEIEALNRELITGAKDEQIKTLVITLDSLRKIRSNAKGFSNE